MDYLLLQILIFLFLAAAIGFFIGWLTRGSSFETRLISLENQWRSRHHVLQSEKKQLQTELDQYKQEGLTTTPNNEAVRSLPFQPQTQAATNTPEKPVQSHPLDRLRDEISQIEESHKYQQEYDHYDSIPTYSRAEAVSPQLLEQPMGEADDLQVIRGIGPKTQATLYKLGIYHLKQIAEFSEGNINWINDYLDFKGKIEREDWVSQALELTNTGFDIKNPRQKT